MIMCVSVTGLQKIELDSVSNWDPIVARNTKHSEFSPSTDAFGRETSSSWHIITMNK